MVMFTGHTQNVWNVLIRSEALEEEMSADLEDGGACGSGEGGYGK